MKLPFTTRDTASSLQRAISERDEAKRKLAELHKQRAAVLLDAELAEVEAIDRQIEAAHHAAGILADRILALDARLHAEEAAERTRRYMAAVDSVEKLTLPLETVAGEVEGAMKALSSACRRYADLTAKIERDWPDGVSRPGYHVGTRRLGERLKACFAMSSVIYSTNHQPVPAMDFVRRATDAADRAEGFGAGEVSNRSEMLQELRQHGAAPIAVTDDDEAVAA